MSERPSDKDIAALLRYAVNVAADGKLTVNIKEANQINANLATAMRVADVLDPPKDKPQSVPVPPEVEEALDNG